MGHRDVVAEGFKDALPCQVDAVFLDLPSPWEVVKHVQKVLKRGKKTTVRFKGQAKNYYCLSSIRISFAFCKNYYLFFLVSALISSLLAEYKL